MLKSSVDLNTFNWESLDFFSMLRIELSGVAASGSDVMAAFNFLDRESVSALSPSSMMSQLWACALWGSVWSGVYFINSSVLLEWFCMLWPLSWCLWQHLSRAHQHASIDPTRGSPQSGLALTPLFKHVIRSNARSSLQEEALSVSYGAARGNTWAHSQARGGMLSMLQGNSKMLSNWRTLDKLTL